MSNQYLLITLTLTVLTFIFIVGTRVIHCQENGTSTTSTTTTPEAAPSSGDFLTDMEQKLVDKLRPSVENILDRDFMKEDAYLVRFLRATNYNVRQARERIERVMTWRKENKMDTILLDDYSLVENEVPVVFEGVDNAGRPLIIVNAGMADLRKIVLSGQIQKLNRIIEAVMEIGELVVPEIHERTGQKNITKGFGILDLAGFNLRQHACIQCLPFVPHIFRTYENYYPDGFHRVYVINTPRIALPIYELIRPFLSPPSRKAVEFFDSNSDHWKKVLLSEIPADQLPTVYGGTRKVVPKTLAQLRAENPYIKAIFEKAKKRAASIKRSSID